MAKKLLCLGGPYSGKMEYPEDCPGSYYQYNRADRDNTIPSAVMIHDTVLELYKSSKASKPSRTHRHRKAEISQEENTQVWEVERAI